MAVLGMAVISGWSDRSVLLVLLAGGSLVFQAADTVDLWFQSRSQSRRTVVAKLAAYLLSGGVKVALILAEAPLAAFAAVLAFEAMSAALGLFFAHRRFRCSQPWRLVWVQGRQLLDESWPFILSGLSIMAYIRIDQIMIKEMLGERALGIYAVILPLSTFWQIIPTTFSVSLAPFIAKQRLAGEAQYRKTIVLVFRAFFYLGVLVALITYFVSGWLVPLLFGTQYSEAVEILNVHVISNVFCFMGIAHNLWLVNERNFAVRLYGTVLAGISAVGMNFLTLPWLGLIGASLAAIVAQALAAFLINVFLDRTSFWMQIEAITFRKIKQC
jgi:PST family polysaccharide transporter